MDNVVTTLERRSALMQELEELIDAAEAENRDFTEEEEQRATQIKAEVEAIDRRLDERRWIKARTIPLEEFRAVSRPDPTEGMLGKDARRYSLTRAILAAATGDWRGAELEREASEEIARRVGRPAKGFYVPRDAFLVEQREILKGTASAGGYLVPTETRELIDLLYSRLVIRQAGATVLDGLQGDVAFPRAATGSTAAWVTEGAAPSESSPTFEQVLLQPKSVAAYVDISRKMLIQSAAEDFVRNNLARTIAVAIDRAALHGSGTGGEPRGVQNTTGVGLVWGGANGAAPTWSHIVQLEQLVAVANADVGRLAYITNANVRGKLKQTFVNPSSGDTPVWAVGDAPVNGYRALVSSVVRNDLTKGTGTNLSAIFFGNWEELILALWSGVDVLVDPFTASTTGTVRVVAFQDVDVGLRHPASFSMMVDAITT